jgi:hypothetical protein
MGILVLPHPQFVVMPEARHHNHHRVEPRSEICKWLTKVRRPHTI